MTLHDKSNLRHTIQQRKNFREHGLATVSKPQPHVEQVCLPEALWNLWQLHRISEATVRVPATEELLELQATSTVPTNTEHRQVSSGD